MRMVPASIDLARVPEPVREVLARLSSAGGRAWLVGGTVRDLLCSLPVRDFDVATDLQPAAVAAAVPGIDLRDAALGTCRVADSPFGLVITTLRREFAYRDRRHPDAVQFVDDPREDALRRDFTVNALYADGASGALLDPLGGLRDLAARRLVAIGDPAVRLAEDPLRLLRLLRFSARLDHEIEERTEAAAREHALLLRGLSRERVYDELTRTFTGPRRGRALRRFVDLGFAAALMPAVAAMDGVPQPPQYHPEGDVLTHVCMVLDEVPEDDPVLSWSAVLHDVGKPPTFRVAEDRIRFDGHDTLSASMAQEILQELRAPKALRQDVEEICRDHIRMASILKMRPRRRERWLRERLFGKHLAFHRADCLGSHRDLSIHDAVVDLVAALPPVRPPLLTGADVLAAGVPQGPEVGRVLREVERVLDAADDTEPSRESALAVLHRLAAALVKPEP